MSLLIAKLTSVAVGQPPKIIEEFVGSVNSQTAAEHRQDDQSFGVARIWPETGL